MNTFNLFIVDLFPEPKTISPLNLNVPIVNNNPFAVLAGTDVGYIIPGGHIEYNDHTGNDLK